LRLSPPDILDDRCRSIASQKAMGFAVGRKGLFHDFTLETVGRGGAACERGPCFELYERIELDPGGRH